MPVSTSDAVPYDFSVGVPDPALFPFDTWRRLVASELRAGANSPGRYADPAGHPSLREAVSRYVGVSRSVLCDLEDVLVTNGTQHALDLVSRVVLDPGDLVAVEDPGYPPAATLFAASGMRVAPVPVDEEGLVVEALPPRARLVYVTPSHQFPTGVAMSLRRRVALVEWAQQHDALVVEDDYDSEFRFTSRPLEPLVDLDPSGRVCYVGSFSKTMLPALRLGFVVVPPTLRSALRAARQLSDGFSPVPTQAALARFIDEGMLARHVRKASGVYATRHAAVLAALEPVPGLHVVPSSAGLHVCARLPTARTGDGRRVVSAARRVGVAVESLTDYYWDGQGSASTTSTPSGVEGVAVGYGAVADDRLTEGLRRLVRVLRRETTVS
ncbi:MAG: PLP-dependent aminotransferase family protein [Lapillicoccus sp.]